MKLELTFFKHVKASLHLIIILIPISLIVYYIGLNVKNSLYVIIPLFFTLMLPTLYLHLNYYNESKGYIYELNKDEIKVIEKGSEIIFHKEDFKVIEFYMSGAKLAGLVMRNFPFESYYYAKIIMNDKKEIIIPFLFSNEIDKILTSFYNDVPVIKVKDFYPLIKNN